MKKFVTLFTCLFIALFCAFSAQFLSVPLDNQAYRIIASAELRGIIPPQSDVKPYPASLVSSLLNEILGSDEISEKESEQIKEVLQNLQVYYGNEENRGLKNILNKGFFRTSIGDNTSVTLGAKAVFDERAGLELMDDKIADLQNCFTFYMNGDLFDVMSYNVNVSAMLDRRDEGAWLPNDFTMKADGNYFHGSGNGWPGEIVWGVGQDPEVSASFFNDKIQLRWGAIQRDWGVGVNNFALSKSASELDALELYIKPANWVEYSVLQGSLAKFAITKPTVFGVSWLSDAYHEDLFDNNYTLHRITLNLKKLQVSAYESVLWRKRNELSYYNPFAIYMFVQNSLSDFDSMLCGVDFSLYASDIARVYGAVSISELSSLSLRTFITHARHVIGLQGGIDIVAPTGQFGLFNMQITYMPPFFGTHYPWPAENNPFGNTGFSTILVNKGHSLTYPLYPDSLEFRVGFNTSFDNGLDLNLEMKDQLRSAQYSNELNVGTTYETFMSYDLEQEGNYLDKDFRHNIWSNTLYMNADVSKKLSNRPVTFTFGGNVIVNWERNYTLGTLLTPGEGSDEHGTYFNVGNATVLGDWKVPTFTVLAHVGLSFFY